MQVAREVFSSNYRITLEGNSRINEKYQTLADCVKNKIEIDESWPDRCQFFSNDGLLGVSLNNERYIFSHRTRTWEVDSFPYLINPENDYEMSQESAAERVLDFLK